MFALKPYILYDMKSQLLGSPLLNPTPAFAVKVILNPQICCFSSTFNKNTPCSQQQLPVDNENGLWNLFHNANFSTQSHWSPFQGCRVGLGSLLQLWALLLCSSSGCICIFSSWESHSFWNKAIHKIGFGKYWGEVRYGLYTHMCKEWPLFKIQAMLLTPNASAPATVMKATTCSRWYSSRWGRHLQQPGCLRNLVDQNSSSLNSTWTRQTISARNQEIHTNYKQATQVWGSFGTVA